MKNKIFVMILLVCVCLKSQILAGQTCKFSTNEVDKFTKSRYRAIQEDVIDRDFNKSTFLKFHASQIDSLYFVNFRVTDTEAFIIEKNGIISFLMEDDSVIDGLSMTENVADKPGNLWAIDASYMCTSKGYEKLRAMKIKSIAIYTSKSRFTYDIKAKNSLVIKQHLDCLFNNK